MQFTLLMETTQLMKLSSQPLWKPMHSLNKMLEITLLQDHQKEEVHQDHHLLKMLQLPLLVDHQDHQDHHPLIKLLKIATQLTN
jgi:hypothetical protein